MLTVTGPTLLARLPCFPQAIVSWSHTSELVKILAMRDLANKLRAVSYECVCMAVSCAAVATSRMMRAL